MHSVVFHFCKKGKRRYSPDEPQDYLAKRAAEVRQNRFVRVVPYLPGGGFVVGSVKTRRIFTGCPPICLWASESEVLRDDSLIFLRG